MRFSKGSLEGYLLIDNRASGGGMVESATVTCSHCHVVVVLNPLRTRARGHCRKCDKYVCDNPRCNFECSPLNAVLDRLQERAFKEISNG